VYLVLTLEAADVAVVGRDEEGRLRRPLVLIICAKEQSGTREIRPERFGGRGREEEGRGALGSPHTGVEEEPEDVRQRPPLVHAPAAAAKAEGMGTRV
jgi:hypothetical protein